MARTLWCRNPACQKPYESVAGKWPDICPKCDRPAHWTSQEPIRFSRNDLRFLKSIRIDPETDRDDAA
jgi:hypothetical protein